MLHTQRSYGGSCVAPHHLAASMARDLEAVGSPLRLADFHAYRAQRVTPLATPFGWAPWIAKGVR
jgi:gamma-glutamyltranspeptidase